MATGDQHDIARRLKEVIPPSWYPDPSTNEHGFLQGFASIASSLYGLISFSKLQMRLSTMSGIFIDLFAYDHLGRTITRKAGETDTAWRARVQAALLAERVTRNGMYKAILNLTGKAPLIFEQWNPGDTGAWASRNSPSLNTCFFAWGTRGNGVSGFLNGWPAVNGNSYGGAGAWGTRTMPNAVMMTVFRPGLQGVPNRGGWASRTSPTNSTLGGWASNLVAYTANSVLGAFAWISRSQTSGSVTDQDIYDLINVTKPLGVAVWTQLI